MATEKKDYVDVIEAATAMAVVVSTRNKLNKVRARTEDQRLKTLLDKAITRLDQSTVRSPIALNLKQPEYGDLYKHCESMLRAAKPQWQALAEQNGWSPAAGAAK
jgi:hypothetical protein